MPARGIGCAAVIGGQQDPFLVGGEAIVAGKAAQTFLKDKVKSLAAARKTAKPEE